MDETNSLGVSSTHVEESSKIASAFVPNEAPKALISAQDSDVVQPDRHTIISLGDVERRTFDLRAAEGAGAEQFFAGLRTTNGLTHVDSAT